MSRITDALEKLRVKCTEAGHSPVGNSIADILDCIAEHFSGGGSALPAVTADDNGDVLTVVEGAWAKSAPSGGAFVVRLDTTGDGTATSDVPIEDVYAAALSGVPVIAKVFMGNTIQFVCSLTQADERMLMHFGTYEDEETFNHFPAVSTWCPQNILSWRINKPLYPDD